MNEIITVKGKRYKLIEEDNLIKIPDLNIEITQLKEWTKPYNEIPKGFRLIRLNELLFIWENEEYRNFFFKEYFEKPKYMAIACEQLWNDKKNKKSRWVCLGRYLGLDSVDNSLQDSNADGRVVFCRSIK
jgi:hypothetical protein